MALAQLTSWIGYGVVIGLFWCKVCPNFLCCCFLHIIILKDIFSSMSCIIIYVICGSAKKYAHGEVKEENAEENILRV